MHTFHAPYGLYRDTPRDAFELTPDAKRVRRYLEDFFLEHRRGPSTFEIAAGVGFTPERLWDALHVLERAVQVMFVPGTENLVKMPPFSYVPTRHLAMLGDGRSWHVGCAGEACAFPGLFPGETVTVTSRCPDCWEELTITIRGDTVIDLQPETVVLHMGIHVRDIPIEWNATCDSFNFFASPDHVQRWEAALPEKRGVTMGVDRMVSLVQGIATTRYWDYDRGSDSSGSEAAVIGNLAALGVDVSAWQ
jgi:hypothetical protein